MSEQHRVAFTTLGSAKKQAKSKPKSDTVRITINLAEPSGDSCPVFSYTALVNSVERKKKKENEKIPNGSIDHIHDCDEEQLKRIAQQYEDKYGTKENRFSNYNELGAGYDDGDSFIDNSEALDEALSEQVEPEYGGYYVNVGQLQLKHLDGSENSEDEELNVRTHNLKRAARAIVSGTEEEDSENDEDEDEEGDEEGGDSREENHTAIKENKLPSNKVAERLDVDDLKSDVVANETDKVRNKSNGEIRNKKQKRKLDPTADHPVEKKKKKFSKSLTVKKLLEEKRIGEAPSECADKETLKKLHNSVNDVIESVVNASRTVNSFLDKDSDISNGSKSSSSLSRNGDISDAREKAGESSPPASQVPSHSTSANQMNLSSNPYVDPHKDIVPLPPNLPEDILGIINYIKQYPANFQNLGKSKFFSPSINTKLLSLECKSRDVSSRHQIYAHLACFVPCGKETLMKRAKKLLIDVEEETLGKLVNSLKAAVDRIMPSVLEKYSEACQKASKEKYIEDSVSGCASSNSETRPKSKVPRRVFPWNDELKSYVRQIIETRLRIFKLVKSRKDTAEDFVSSFVTLKLKPLWPHGWMKVSTILKIADIQQLTNFSKRNTPTSGYQKKHNSGMSTPNLTTPVPANVAPVTPVSEPSQPKKPASVPPPPSNSFKDKFKETSLPEIDMFSDPIDLLSKITSAISPKSQQQNCKPSTSPQLPLNHQTSPSQKEKPGGVMAENKKPDTLMSKHSFNIDQLMDFSKKEVVNTSNSSSRSQPVMQYPKSNDQVLDLSPVKTPVNQKTPETVSVPTTASSYSAVSSDSSRANFSATSFVPHVSSGSHILPVSLPQVPSLRTSPPSLPHSHASSTPHMKHLSTTPPKPHPSISPNPLYPPMPKTASSPPMYFKNAHYPNTNTNSNSYPMNVSQPSYVSNSGALCVSSPKSTMSVSALPHITSSYEMSADRASLTKSSSYVSPKNAYISPPTPVSSQISPKDATKPVSLKHRILQDSMKAQAESDLQHMHKESKPLKLEYERAEVTIRPTPERDVFFKTEADYREDLKKSTYDDIKEETTKFKTEAEREAEQRMIEETMTATDVLNQIINESLQDMSPVVHNEISPMYQNEIKQPQLMAIQEDAAMQERKVRSQSIEEGDAVMQAVIKNFEDLQKMSGSKLNNSECSFSIPPVVETSKFNNNVKGMNSNEALQVNNQSNEASPETTSIPKVSLGFQDEFYKHLLSDGTPATDKAPMRGPETADCRPYTDPLLRPTDSTLKNKGYSQPSPMNHRSVIVPVSTNQSGWLYREQNYHNQEPSQSHH